MSRDRLADQETNDQRLEEPAAEVLSCQAARCELSPLAQDGVMLSIVGRARRLVQRLELGDSKDKP